MFMIDDKDDEPPSNVVDFIKKTAPPARRMTSAAILDGLELTKVFLRIRSAAERKRILRMVREIADSDANKRT
jgi:hypothetical protein